MRIQTRSQGLVVLSAESLFSDHMTRTTDNRALATEYVEKLRRLVEAEKEHGARTVIGVSRATLGRLLGGLSVTPSVRFMVETKLREYAARAA